ncbi:MAG TPA: PEFG-CTERM sorting domain-containing protein [Nitrosarchaeum sp.]|nr:PEFG-CTERM sorting domain-containing protein [Nitrosarchaeum sp.]
MNYWVFLFLPFLIFNTSVFAQTPDSNDSNYSEYVLEIEPHTYPISYVVNADVIAMEIDPESKSLLIGLDNAYDSQFFIKLEHELINAQNNEFVILVNGQDVDYEVTSDSTGSALTFFIPTGSEEVEIIGTSVVPEFPIGAIFGFAVMISTIMIFAKIKAPFFKL